MRLVTDMVEFCSERMPRWHPISISGYHIREAGSTAQQELAFTLKDGFTYVEQALERGLDVDAFAPRLSFFFNAHIDFFEEIAKYRAARRIWARELRDTLRRARRAQPADALPQPDGRACRSRRSSRSTTSCAPPPRRSRRVLGGTQSLHTNSFDEALALPTEGAVRVALRTQQIIAHETGVTNTIDPLGGSYFVEALTDRMEEAAYGYFAKIDELGGMVEAIKQNYPQREIADASFRLQEEIERGDRIVVGVNRYESDDAHTDTLRIPAELERKQIGRVQARARRAATARRWSATLAELREAAAAGPQPDGAAARRGARPRERGRDRAVAPARVRHLHRDARLLGRASDGTCPVSPAIPSRRRRRGAPQRGTGARLDVVTSPKPLIATCLAAMCPGAAGRARSRPPRAATPATSRAPPRTCPSAPVDAIDGQHRRRATDQDLYRVCLEGGGTFSATTVGGTELDTQLFLFDAAGPRRLRRTTTRRPRASPRFPRSHELTPDRAGRRTCWRSRPTTATRGSAAGAIFGSGGVLAPTVPGAAQPLSGWTGRVGLPGDYRIALTGTAGCAPPDATPPTVDLGARRRRPGAARGRADRGLRLRRRGRLRASPRARARVPDGAAARHLHARRRARSRSPPATTRATRPW